MRAMTENSSTLTCDSKAVKVISTDNSLSFSHSVVQKDEWASI